MGKKKIFLLDDEPAITSLLKMYLEGKGYEVKTESSPLRSIAAIREFRPDLLILDVNMPEMEGGDFAALLKDEDDLKEIPIIFLTGAVTKEEADSRHGVIGGYPFIAKPVDLAKLMACIDGIFRRISN